MSLAEGDLLRRAMSGKGVGRATLLAFRDRFQQGCRERGIPPDIAREVWRQIASFAGYAFCKAHSASFAVLSYRVAWYKAHRPAAFMAAVLNNEGGFFSTAAYVQEARRLGLELRGPCLRHGADTWQGAAGRLRSGLRAVTGLGRESREELWEQATRRPWSSFTDLRRRGGLSRPELEQLIFSGACDELAGGGDPRHLRPALLWELRARASQARRGAGTGAGGRRRHPFPGTLELDRLLAAQAQALGFGLCRHPLELFDFEGLEGGCVSSLHLRDRVGERVRMIGWKFAQKPIRTRNSKERMAFLSLEDTRGTWEAVLFPRVWERHALLLRESGPFLLEGRVELEAEEPMLQVERMERVGRLSERMARAV